MLKKSKFDECGVCGLVGGWLGVSNSVAMNRLPSHSHLDTYCMLCIFRTASRYSVDVGLALNLSLPYHHLLAVPCLLPRRALSVLSPHPQARDVQCAAVSYVVRWWK